MAPKVTALRARRGGRVLVQIDGHDWRELPEDVIGSHVRVKVVKNKVAPPFKQAEFDIMYAEGISHTSLLVDIGAESGIIEKSGAW